MLRLHAFGALVRAIVVLCGLSLSVLTAQTIRYRLVAARPLSRFTSKQLVLLMKLNHVDPTHLAQLSRILAPDRWDLDELLTVPKPATGHTAALSRGKGDHRGSRRASIRGL